MVNYLLGILYYSVNRYIESCGHYSIVQLCDDMGSYVVLWRNNVGIIACAAVWV